MFSGASHRVLLYLSSLFAVQAFPAVPGSPFEVLPFLTQECQKLLASQARSYNTVDFGAHSSPFGDELSLLNATNAQLSILSRSPISVEGTEVANNYELLLSMGFIHPGNSRVEKVVIETTGSGETQERTQKIPYYELLFPKAKTGIYFPHGPVGPHAIIDEIDAILIVLPGIGFDFSTAKSVVPIAGTFNNVVKGKSRKKINSAIPCIGDRPLSLLTLPMDAPLNGMGEESPFGFGRPEHIVQVMRHIHLVLNVLYFGKPVFFLGRSQGGANALEYASYYADAAGVIAINPSHPDPRIVADVIKKHSDPNSEIVRSLNLVPHDLSWAAHNLFTASYRFWAHPSHSEVLLALSANDPSYDQTLYRPAFEGFLRNHAEKRSLLAFDDVPAEKAHNLIDPANRNVYDRMVSEIGNFVINQGNLEN